jgi:hypothetical protein
MGGVSPHDGGINSETEVPARHVRDARVNPDLLAFIRVKSARTSTAA